MNVKLSSIYGAKSALSTVTTSVLPIKLSYKLGKILKKFGSVLNDIEGKRNDLIVDKYGVKDDKGLSSVPDDKYKEFSDEFTVYLQQEIDLDIWTLPLSELVNGGLRLSPAQILALDEIEGFIINDLPEEPTKVK